MALRISSELAEADEFREPCVSCTRNVSVAQLDRAADFGSAGWGFESLQAREFSHFVALCDCRRLMLADQQRLGVDPLVPKL